MQPSLWVSVRVRILTKKFNSQVSFLTSIICCRAVTPVFYPPNKSGSYRIFVDIIDSLHDHFLGIKFDGMISILPYFVAVYSLKWLRSFCKCLKDPISSAFLYFIKALYDLFITVSFEISKDLRKTEGAPLAHDHMQVIWHQTPGMDNQSLF